MTGAYLGQKYHEVSVELWARLAGSRAKNPISFGIDGRLLL
jgi:hypothetical protein